MSYVAAKGWRVCENEILAAVRGWTPPLYIIMNLHKKGFLEIEYNDFGSGWGRCYHIKNNAGGEQ
jgi:hypothetical protein